MLRLRRGTWWEGKSWFVVAVLRLRGRGGFGALCLGCGFLGSVGGIDSVGDGIEVDSIQFERLIVKCKMRLEKSGFLLELAAKSVG